VSLNNNPFFTAAHYFGRCSMGNFWNTFETHRVRSDFAEIAADGFNTIILILPWAHFQPKYHPVEYDQDILNRFQFLMDEARRVGFRLMLRLGYLWENSKARVSTYQRYRLLFYDTKILDAWNDFVKKIESIVGEDAKDVIFFLSWEDPYWPVLRIPQAMPLEKRISYGRDIGLIDFLKRRFTYSLLKKIYRVNASSYDELPVPTIEESLFAEFALFFDREYIEKWILMTRAVLTHELWYEHRVDPDDVKSQQSPNSIEHSTYKPGIACDVIYYHPKIGVADNTKMNTVMAANHLRRTLSGFRQNNFHRLPVFLDQFNFKIDNPKHPEISILKDEYVVDFLELCEPIFRLYLIGYGIWGYRDWRNDKVFNGAFELGLVGWSSQGANLVEEAGIHGLVLLPGAVVSQELDSPSNLPRCYFEFDQPAMPTKIQIGNGKSVLTLDITPEINFTEVVFQSGGRNLELRCMEGALCLRKVAYFSHVFTNGMRGIDGSSRAVLRSIAQLNRTLLRETSDI
jgi:hypothetical protein